jgi:hypothetical protein
MNERELSLDEVKVNVGKVYDLWEYFGKLSYANLRGSELEATSEETCIREYILSRYREHPSNPDADLRHNGNGRVSS